MNNFPNVTPENIGQATSAVSAQSSPGQQATLTHDLDEKFTDAKRARLVHESQWLLNLAFYVGRQWVTVDPLTQRITAPVVPPWRVLITVNFIQGAVATLLAKLTKNRPRALVETEGADPDQARRAKASNKILDFLWKRTATNVASRQAMLWSLILGTGIVKQFWDPSAGDEIAPGLHIGEIVANAVSPFEFYPDPTGDMLADKAWAFHVKLRSSAYVRDKYGVDVEEEQVTSEDSLDGKIATLLDQPFAQMTKGVLVKEFWERSSAKHPQGRYVVYAREKVLHAVPNPYPKWQMPFVAWQAVPLPGVFWGDSVVSGMLDAQRNYNKSRSQAVEIRNLMSKPKWMIPFGALPDGITITSAPGENIVFNGAQAPVSVAGKDVPSSFWRDLQLTRSELYDISGQHEVSSARVPTGVTAASAIGLLQEQDDTRLGPTAEAYEDAIEILEMGKLHLARQFYIEPRTARVVGKNAQAEVMQFSREDIPEDASIEVVAGSSLPTSAVAKRAFIIDLWHEKIIKDPRKVLEILEFGDTEGIYDDITLDINRAERENEQMKQGQPTTAQRFDSHELHLRTHDAFRKTEEYEQIDPKFQAIFEAHDMQHISLSVMIARAQAEISLQSSPRMIPDVRLYNKNFDPNTSEQILEQRGVIEPPQQPGAQPPPAPGMPPPEPTPMSPQGALQGLGLGPQSGPPGR